VKSNGQVKVSDFGLTGISSGLSNEQVFKTCQGTILYMSPERLSDDKHSFKADIWSLGVVCIELCMGKLPYEHQNNFFDIMQEATQIGSIQLSDELFSKEFQEFIGMCLKNNPDERPNAMELLQSPFIKKYENGNLKMIEEFVKNK
jgi:serine/threonine protein kinase